MFLKNLPWQTLALALFVLLLYQAGPEALEYQRHAIAQGEWWRLLSGHWLHYSLSHLGWNLAALLILGWLFEPHLGWRMLPLLSLGMLSVDTWLWWGVPQLTAYTGLSGILNTLLAAGLWYEWRRTRNWLVWPVAVLVVVKIAVEWNSTGALLVDLPPVPQAHMAGLLAGGMGSIILLFFPHRTGVHT